MFSLISALDRAMERKVAFLGTFFLIFTLTYAVFAAFDILPEPVTDKAVVVPKTPEVRAETPAVAPTAEAPQVRPATTTDTITPKKEEGASAVQSAGAVLPQSLTIDALGRTVTVLNPASKSIASLDAALLKGVVRHPDSATLNEEGNIFILGHSSYLPTVHNKNFQALNGIQNLKWGDTITVGSPEATYTYRVEKVYKAKASGLTIPVAGKGKRLTLATCNSFGSTDDRYIVEASLQSTKLI